jgi:hypothetical protein
LVADFENVGIDEKGYLFPIHPFFSPKNLIEIYLDLPPFDGKIIRWNHPLKGKRIETAVNLLRLLKETEQSSPLGIYRIDLSKLDALTLSQREIVFSCRDTLFYQGKSAEVERLLRVCPVKYAQQLGNYRTLRLSLLEKERSLFEKDLPLSGQVIDLRLSDIAFMQPLKLLEKEESSEKK